MTEAEPLTEEEWMTTPDTWRMLHVIRRVKPSERKVRLLNVALCHLFWGYLSEASKAIISELESLADRLAVVTPDELCRRANEAVPPLDKDFKSSVERETAKAVCYAVLPQEMFVAAGTCQKIDPSDDRPLAIIRDIFGNPFRPATINSAWQTTTVSTLAQSAYDNRLLPAGTLDPDRLAILADALEEAGCTNPDILNHLRQPGDHVRGCWPLDLLLKKECRP